MLNPKYTPGLLVDISLMILAGFRLQGKLSPAYFISCIIAFTSVIGIATIIVSSRMCPEFLLTRAFLVKDSTFPIELMSPEVPLLNEILLGIWLTVRWSALAGGLIVGGYELRHKTRLWSVMGMVLGSCLELAILMNMQYPTLLLACPAEALRW